MFRAPRPIANPEIPNGPLRVLDVLQRPVFKGAQLVAGGRGVHRLVKWVHILEVPDTRALINGGELVLTTGSAMRGNEAEFLSYVKQLIEAGAAGLCVELGTAFPAIPGAVLQVAEDSSFPLIVFPNRVRFVDITQDVHKLIFLQERQFYHEQEWVEQCVRGGPLQAIWHATPVSHAPRRCRVVVLRSRDGIEFDAGMTTGDWPTHRRELALLTRAVLAQHRLWAYLSVRPDAVVAILDTDAVAADWRDRLVQAIAQLEQALRGRGWLGQLCAGAGSEVQVSRKTQAALAEAGGPVQGETRPTVIADSYEEAVAAAELCARRRDRTLICFDAPGMHQWTVRLSHDPRALAMARAPLAALLEHDRKHRTNLLETLKVYLDADRSKRQTADRLHIHRQTLYHRLEQIHALLGVDLDDPEQRLAIHLSVYVHLANEDG